MDLSTEDALRLNVLLRQKLYAVRIDESRMAVHALSDKGEAKVRLNPNCKDELYLRSVRLLLSSHVLGSPGGYPVYLKRWTRMGQARNESLEKLLLLGEPEAIAAVVHAQGLTDELARRAWWLSPTAENARRMLEREVVAKGKMGSVLADFLVEFLPFEEDPQAIIDSVRLVLQPGLTGDKTKAELWERGRRKNTYYVGFLEAQPDNLPIVVQPHPEWASVTARLQTLTAQANVVAVQLDRTLSGHGQAFLQTSETVLRKPLNQDVVVALLDAVGDYFSALRTDTRGHRDIESIATEVAQLCDSRIGSSSALSAVLEAIPDMRAQCAAMLALSMCGEQLVAPIFGLTDAIGSVMRKKIAPITAFALKQFAVLRAA
jgi:hypothetical protein